MLDEFGSSCRVYNNIIFNLVLYAGEKRSGLRVLSTTLVAARPCPYTRAARAGGLPLTINFLFLIFFFISLVVVHSHTRVLILRIVACHSGTPLHGASLYRPQKERDTERDREREGGVRGKEGEGQRKKNKPRSRNCYRIS